jgi:hypothetical protein
MMSSNKDDYGKTRYDLVYPDFEEAVANALTKGAIKYGPYSWMQLPDAENRYYSALRRHLNAYTKGEHIDEDGQSHLAHAAANIMFLMYFENNKNEGAKNV